MKRILLTIMTCGVICASMLMGSQSARERKWIEVQAGTASVYDLKSSVIATGSIEGEDILGLYPESSARVTEIFVKEGDFVKEGEPLMELRPYVEELAAGTGGALAQAIEEYGYTLEGYENGGAEITEILPVFGAGAGVYEEEHITLTAPSDGLVTAMRASRDGTVSPFLPCVTITKLDRVFVRAQVSEIHAHKIRENQKAEVTGDAFPDRIYEGVVTTVMPFATQTGSIVSAGETVVEVLIEILNPDDALKPGYTASAKITSDQRGGALIVPYEAISQDTRGQEYVYIIDRGLAKRRDVETGIETDEGVEIKRGITHDELIILSPSNELRDGSLVRLRS